MCYFNFLLLNDYYSLLIFFFGNDEFSLLFSSCFLFIVSYDIIEKYIVVVSSINFFFI